MIEFFQHLDHQLFFILNHHFGPGMDQFMYIVTQIPTWFPLYLLIFWFFYRKLGWKGFLAAVLAAALMILVTDQTCNFFKTYTPKFRPTHNPAIMHLVNTVNNYRGGLYGTVSGHAANSFAIAAFTSLIFRRKWVTAGMMLWAALVAYSRLYVGVHFPLDIFFGTLLGFLTGFGGYRLFLWFRDRFAAGNAPSKSKSS